MAIREIYIRNEKDPYYIPGTIDFQNEIESVITQIRMILGTRKGDVLGSYDFGVDLDYMVWGTKRNAEDVAEAIRDQIRDYVRHGKNITVDVTVDFGDSGEGYDYAVINIYINGQKSIGFLIDKNDV